jgi:hypothetical protein
MEGLPALAGLPQYPAGASVWILNFALAKISLYEKHNHMVTYGAEVVDAHDFFLS